MLNHYLKTYLSVTALLLFFACDNTIKIAALECDRLSSENQRSRCKEAKMGGSKSGFYLSNADKKIQKGNIYGSINDLNQAIKVNPQSLTATYRKALMLSRLGQNGDAINAFDKVIKMNPKHADAHFYKAITLNEIHRYQDAVNSLNEAIRIRPNYAVAHFEKAKLLLDLQREEQATESFTMAYAIWKRKLKYNPNYFSTQKGMEKSYKITQRFLFTKGLLKKDKKLKDPVNLNPKKRIN